MSLLSGTRLGAYEVVSLLGAGGMGEVYRARDGKLNRDVAIKILPDAFALDPDRLARFEQEAQTLAALNHENIAHVYGVLERPAALVMELVEGEDLSAIIARGAMPVADVLPIARQIAEALEAAHEQGIIHRDLKPANIRLRADGAVKVLDFGLAKPTGLDGVGATALATVTSPARTAMGVILGTAAYMSPEQARGMAADHRSDIFSFGAVLYEMLTARQPFPGHTVSDVIASVLAREPDLSALPVAVPRPFVAVIRRCMDKSPRARWQAIGDVRYELEAIAAGSASLELTETVRSPARPLWRGAWLPIASAVGGAVLVWAIGRPVIWNRIVPASPAPISHLLIEVPADAGQIAISPDGSRIVLTTGTQLLLRRLGDFDAAPVSGVDARGVANPLFSPDGQSIVFSIGSVLKRVPAAGGVAVDIATLPAPPLGLCWAGNDILAGLGSHGVFRVPIAGGPPTPVVKLSPGEHAAMPRLLPGADAVLFTMTTGSPRPDWDKSRIVVQSLSTGARDVVVASGSDAQYLPGGVLAYAVQGVWFGVPFDVATRRTSGLPVALLEGIARVNVSGRRQPQAIVAVSDTGTLVYRSGRASLTDERTLVMTDRAGKERSLGLPPKRYESPRISPDGRFLAVSSSNGLRFYREDQSVRTS